MLLGVVLIVLGLAFVALGLAVAIRAAFPQNGSGVERGGATDPESWSKLIASITELVKVAPQWLLFVLIGLALVAVGITQL